MARHFKRRDLIATMVVVVALIAMVLAPALGNARRKAARISCTCHLKQIGLAFRIYANDNDNLYPMQVSEGEDSAKEAVERGYLPRIFMVMSNELSVPKIAICPSDTRIQATNWTGLANTNLSYFVGVDAEDTRYNMVLSGDRNIAVDGNLLSGMVQLGTNSPLAWTGDLHQKAGNIGLADGSVQQVTSELLKRQLATSGDATNRVLFPQ
jgi:hypothetical protein